jgi:chromosome partitioning protein
MADFRTRLTLQVIEEVRKFFKEKTFNTIIPRNIKLAEAPSFGKPIHFYDALCVGAKAYLNLTEEILKEKIDIGQLIKNIVEGLQPQILQTEIADGTDKKISV